MEDDFLGRKPSRIQSAKSQEAAIAFANSDGGEIIIEIEDDRDKNTNPIYRWIGFENIEGCNSFIENISSLNPGIDFTHDYLHFNNNLSRSNYVLHLKIKKAFASTKHKIERFL